MARRSTPASGYAEFAIDAALQRRANGQLNAFKNDYPQAKCFYLYGGKTKEFHGDITVLPIASLLGEAIHRIHTGLSIGAMFEQ